MKRKFYLLVSLLLAVGLLSLMAGCDKQEQTVNAPVESVQIDQPDSSASGQAEKATPTLADKAWWRGLSQAARNQAILERAWRDNNRYVGQNCKNWARTVVLAASRNVVYLPSTLPNENGWYFDTSPYLRKLSGIRAVFPGCVVQTVWKFSNGNTTPHTFIVLSTSPTGFGIIECNWTPGTVTSDRFFSFSDFEGQVVNYTCYSVIGG